MSGFERSAPIPGSQGPRRSQMTRFNNAPPPESPWRLEVLEAKKAAEAAIRKAKGERSRSRSRNRSRERDRHRRKAGEGSAPSSSTAKKGKEEDKDILAKKIVRAREVGEGWFAAVAAASSAWDAIPEQPKKGSGKAFQEGGANASSKRKDEDRRKPDLDAREKERFAKEEKARLAQELEEEAHRREEQKLEQERMEERWQAEAEAREKRRLEEKKKLEEDKRVREQQEKQRRQKLGNAFAVDGDSDDEEQKKKREAEALRKASERKRSIGEVVSTQPISSSLSVQAATVYTPQGPIKPLEDKELAGKLGFDGNLDPAEAFIRLQERKRKGRRSEFGGPPRGCSPWRDGKRGVVTPLAQSRQEWESKARERRA